ncbi:MAG: hypothetical protein ACLUW6_00600 [Coriobacteriaceae bacterium]
MPGTRPVTDEVEVARRPPSPIPTRPAHRSSMGLLTALPCLNNLMTKKAAPS